MADLVAKTKELCRLFEIKPSKSKGQNFLINERVYDEIILAADLQAGDTVLEIGPGLGFLTAKLAATAKKVIAVELDDRLANYLQTGLDTLDIENVLVINEDILRFNLSKYLPSGEPYKIVANLPYNISSIFLRQFLTSAHKPTSLVLMLQKEVAERIVASPPDMSILAISVQYYAEAEIIKEVKAGNFWPEPKVDSALIKIKLKPVIFEASQDKLFFRLVKIGFSAKRKMLKNNLVGGLKIDSAIIENIIKKNGLEPQVRAEGLSLENWHKLFADFREFMI